MTMSTYASKIPEEIHTDVLSKARESCYKARDAFYACFEKESDKKPTEVGCVGLLYPVECKSSRVEYEKSCRASWVKHFDRQYCRNKRVQRLLDDRDSRRECVATGLGSPCPNFLKEARKRLQTESEALVSNGSYLDFITIDTEMLEI